MTVAAPFPLAGGAISRWQVNDWIIRAGATEPAAAGTALLVLPQLDGNEQWLIDHATAECTSTEPTRVRWYETSVGSTNLLDGSETGNFDVADWPAGLLVRPSTSLVAVWSGCSDGAVGFLRLQARQLRQVSS